MSRPVDIAHSPKRNQLTVTWDDGTVSELPIPYLRGWCPCAACQGHGIEVAYHQPPEGIEVEGLYEMGAYALGIRFTDGHDSGIYSWSWLRKISSETSPSGPKYGKFVGERYVPPAEP